MTQQHDLPLEEYHRAGREMTNGNPEAYEPLYSCRDDVTLANPSGPPVRGWLEVSATLDRAAQNYRDGEVVGFENVSTVMTPDLAYKGAHGRRAAAPATCRRPRRTAELPWRGDLPHLISCFAMAKTTHSLIGRTAAEAAGDRAARSDDYRAARDEYARIRELRKTNPIAAHLRERRFELGLTQQDVATAASTSHTAISRLERGTHTPNLATLQRIAAVLEEELLVCFQRTVDGELERDYAAVA